MCAVMGWYVCVCGDEVVCVCGDGVVCVRGGVCVR